MKKSPLQKQLDEQKFQNAIAYVRGMAGGLKKLTSSEMVYLNQLLTGHSDDPWRIEAVEVQIPSGERHQFNLISNPLSRARDIIGNAFQKAGNSDVSAAASYFYSQLVLEHLFIDANRRTAVLATLWLILVHKMDLDAQELLTTPLGNLRDPENIKSLGKRIEVLLRPLS